jgi:glycosyltransferase involved in cell wall biosynthesis
MSQLSSNFPQPLVSILIPTHNRPEYFEIALKSALAQSYENFEVVVSDNSSDDLTARRIEPYL